jgi:pimeloyl-ACP methyl ester carboxylesterase
MRQKRRRAIVERQHHYLSDDGLRLFYREFDGDRSRLPLLCMHGLTRNSGDFIDLARHLAPARRVLACDVRGRGLSARDPDWQNYQPPVYAQDMWRLLDHAGVGAAVLVGTSMGGIMAMLMAVQQPQRVAALILNDIGPEVDAKGLARIAAYAGAEVPLRNWDEAVAQMRQRYGAALPGLDDDFWRRYTRASFREGPGGALEPDYDPAIANRFAQDSGDAGGKLWELFTAIRQPVLVLRGETSDILSRDTLQRMAVLHPQLQAVEVPARGHVPLLDEPAALAAIDRFLAALP